MLVPRLILALLLVVCLSLSTWLAPRFEVVSQRRGPDVLSSVMGESRKLFANHFFTRSDVYFHSGYYPSMFDQAKAGKENHLAEQAASGEKPNPPHGQPGHVHSEHEEPADDHDHGKEEEGHVHDEHCQHGEEHDFLGKPKDFMDAFSRHFFVSSHTHLTDKGTNAPKEILPWIQLAAKLDPNMVRTYTVGAYWLRDLHKDAEAEQFLREGLRQNPGSYEIMLELGRCYYDRKDDARARNVLEQAMERWRAQENGKEPDQQDRLSAQQILNHLALVEERFGNRDRAVRWLEIVRKLSPHPEEIDKRIAEVRAGLPLQAK